MSSAVDADTAAKIREYAVNQPEKAPIEILGHFAVDPSRAGAVKRIVEAARNGDEIDLELDTETDDTDDTDDENETDDVRDRALEALTDAVEYYHTCVDETIDDHQEGGEHPERPDTAREYFRARGWSDETIDANRLGWAPPDDGELVEHLRDRGHDRDAILGTGLFSPSNGEITPLNNGRYILPYFDDEGRAIYLIGRCTDTGESPGGGAAGYNGHPDDFLAGKYSKLSHTKEYAYVTEPMWGQHTVEDGEPVVIAEGIADAIAAEAAGYSVLSPVAKEFKREHIAPLVTLLDDHDVPRVYVIPDSETAVVNRREDAPDDPDRIADVLTLPTTPPGIGGGLRTAAHLANEGVEALVAELPRLAGTPETRKVDLDDYLNGSEAETSLEPVLASARGPKSFPEYEKATGSLRRSSSSDDENGDTSAVAAGAGRDGSDFDGDLNGAESALFTLQVTDLTPAQFSDDGDRGKNPLGHRGTSESYFTLVEGGEGDLIGKDYKAPGNPTYNALTYLLVDAGERDVERPMGPLSDRELFVAWRHAKERGAIPADDPMPRRALVHVALDQGLCSEEDVDDGWKLPLEAHNAAIKAVRDDYEIDPGLEPITAGSGSGHSPGPRDFCETCEPPLTAHAEPLDVDARRDEMQGEAYDRFVETDDLTLWAYNPGEGKTTNGSVAPAERERPFVVALPKHENCREFQLDEMKPDDCYHLKGAAQPEGNECMDASIDDRDCKDHGHGSNCPSMCPVYDLDQDHPKRVLFDVFAAAGKSRKAHALLGLYDESWHGESCAWLDQWEELENVDRIVTVHQYLRLKSVREHGDILIDDIGAGFVDDETVNVDALSRCRQALRKYARFAENDDERVADTLRLLEMFTDDLIAELAEGAIDLRELEAPTFPPTTRTYDDRDEIPDHVDEADISETRSKQYVGEGGQYVYQEAYEIVTKDLAETLAQARHFYEESVLTAMREGEWNGTPLCLDTVYGALAAALDDQEAARAVRVAIEADVTLDACPRCSSRLEARDGARMCDDCGWHEEYDRLTQDHTPPARVDVDVSTTDGGTVELADRRLPSIDSLPDPSDVLILDATPQTAVYAAVFGVDPASVRVEGNDAYELPNATVTQFTNGAYHKGTLGDSSVARSKIQKCLEKVSSIHDNVVYVSLKKVEAMFDWPDTSVDDVMNYYSLRGLDAAKDADAIVLVGAPHPDENDLRAEGRLLALDNPGVRAGGRELSTRTGDRDDPDDDPGPPIYRKLNYVDDDGKGRAMAAKRYSGITGDLFDARHEDELVQAAHRIRPLLADATEEKHIYLCTNVPTDLPVDRVTTFGDFLDPLSGHVEVRDSALDLLGAMVDAATESEDGEPYATDGGLLSVAAVSSEWYEASERAGMDVSERTVRNALGDLRDAGLVEKGEYTQRGGYLQTLTRLGASVAAIRR